MIDELPEGWAHVDFFDFCVLQRGYDLPLSKAISGSYPIVTSAGIAAHHCKFKAKGPGVVTGRSGSIGKVFFVESDYWPHNTALFVKDFKGSDPRYVYYFLRGFDTGQYSASTAVPTLNRNNLKEVSVNVPPVAEQRRIAAKIDAVLAEVDSCRTRLDRIPKILKRFRRAVLGAACSGRLTADWRGKQGKTARAERLGEGTPPDIDLPPTWEWMLSGKIFDFVTSGSRGWAQYYSDKGALFIRVGNLDHDKIALDLADTQRVSPPAGAEGLRTRVMKGDILISITADVGMIGLVEEELGEAYINQHVALARPNNTADRRYLAYFLAAQSGGQQQFLSLQRGATKVGLGLDDIRNVWIARPPVAEQEEIVRRVERFLALADRLQARYVKAKAQVDRLTQSILAKAFRGELVPTEAELAKAEGRSYETATQLLERIKTLRAVPAKRTRSQVSPTRV